MATLCNSCESQDTCEIFEIMGDSMPITHCKNYIQTRRETVRAKQTNADRIRSMTDEELATFLGFTLQDGYCYGAGLRKELKFIPVSEHNEMLEWLRKEADDGHTE